MKLCMICEDKDILILENALRTGVINEDLVDVLDTATEVVFGAVGFIPGVGEVIGDLPMLIKNIAQGDYLGAAIFLVSMEPTPVSDTIAKTLRLIQKVARHTGQEQKLNRFIGYLLQKTGKNPKTTVMSLFTNVEELINKTEEKTGKARNSSDEKTKKHALVLSKVTKHVKKHLPKMKKSLEQFLDLVEEKAKQQQDPIGGADVPDEYLDDLTNKIEKQYRKFFASDVKAAIAYKNKVKANAMKDDAYSKKLRDGYEKIFGKIPDKV